MSKGTGWAGEFLDHIFTNAVIANFGDPTGLRGSVTAGSIYVSLHYADPTWLGDQESNECGYTGYARAAVVRSAAGWTVTGAVVTPTVEIEFPESTDDATPQTATHWGIGTNATGSGSLLFFGALDPDIIIDDARITPYITTSTTITES
jgi:hypothetical protein